MLLVWHAGDPWAQSLPELQDEGSTKPYAQGFCPVGMGLRNPTPCFAWAELTDARLDPSRLLESCWLHHKPPREPPALPQQGFWWGLVGFQHCWDGAEICKAQPSAWKSSLSWDRAAVLPKERHQTSWTVKTKQWHHSMLQVILVFTGVYTNPPCSFSCILAAALAPWHCPQGRTSRAVLSTQTPPLPRLLGSECFWDLCSSLGCELGQMGFTVVCVGGGETARTGPHTFSHRENLAKNTLQLNFHLKTELLCDWPSSAWFTSPPAPQRRADFLLKNLGTDWM